MTKSDFHKRMEAAKAAKAAQESDGSARPGFDRPEADMAKSAIQRPMLQRARAAASQTGGGVQERRERGEQPETPKVGSGKLADKSDHEGFAIGVSEADQRQGYTVLGTFEWPELPEALKPEKK